jgi:creatinine amidohydrolase
MIHLGRAGLALTGALATAALAIAQAPKQQPKRERVDMQTMVRPIDMHNTVWIEDMTLLEIRDSIKAGKTTALVLVGGMEDNGPYVTVSQHNSIVRTIGDAIARQLGNALCAPVVGMAPGNPETSASPGSIVLSNDTYKNVLADMGASLKAEGFKNILFLVDHGGDQQGAIDTAKTLAEKWKGSGVRAIYVAIDPNGLRLPERVKAHKTTLNGQDMASPKAIADGKKIIAYRTDAAVNSIRQLLADSK